jgi:dipeptidase E
MKLLLISNSTMAGEPYLHWPQPHISAFLGRYGVKKVCFIPYAGVHLSSESLKASYDVYAQKVEEVFQKMGIAVQSVHQAGDPVKAVEDAEAVVTGGGNTFHLVAEMYQTGVMQAIREKVLAGTPYVGWSAGSNVACPTLMTTNDMPIVEPPSFETLNLIPFQINPHYLDANPEGHGGETRQQRIEEFLAVNREKMVVGLREGCLLRLENDRLALEGKKSLRIFKFGKEPAEIAPGSDVTFLMSS